MIGHPVRSIVQPGPPSTCRAVTVPVGALPIEADLPPGARLLDALSALLARHGVDSACLTLSGGALGPFSYVIPALSPDGSQAAFYSATARPAGHSRIEVAAVTVGTREGEPFFHCHALWTEADGRPGCGHVLPDETIIAASIHVIGSGLVGARFEIHPDPETGFNLFSPVSTIAEVPRGLSRAVAVRLAPNQDLIEALERIGREAEFARSKVQGGVASIIGARFEDAPPVTGFATELLVRDGLIDSAGDGTVLEIAIVDLDGRIGTGRLVRGDNPVLMTFEGLLQPAR